MKERWLVGDGDSEVAVVSRLVLGEVAELGLWMGVDGMSVVWIIMVGRDAIEVGGKGRPLTLNGVMVF